MKRISFLLFMLALVANVNVYAYDIDLNGIYYNITSANTVEVTYVESGYGNADFYYGDITIPRRISKDGTTYTVTAIGDSAFWGCRDLTSATIPNSVTSLGVSAFYHCFGLTSVTIPNSVTSLSEQAFRDCI